MRPTSAQNTSRELGKTRNLAKLPLAKEKARLATAPGSSPQGCALGALSGCSASSGVYVSEQLSFIVYILHLRPNCQKSRTFYRFALIFDI